MSFSPPEEAARWYADRVRAHGYDHRGLGFGRRSSQEKRFEALLALGEFDGRRVLDVGCGFGDFLHFLTERGIEADYTGIDICEPMVERCRDRFGDAAGRFLLADVLEFRPEQPFDYVVASGLFGLDAADAHERLRPTVERLFSLGRTGTAMNFLSTRSPTRADARIYVDPCKALEAGLALTPAARVDHTYLPNDFTLYLYPTPAWSGGDGEPTP
ncbi:MAG TPA: class I SAM-dependent methyltransferase [Usitatibacter sp.]|nr:class I SAM-dependent methyltransferase [Usitatibacter sp.]